MATDTASDPGAGPDKKKELSCMQRGPGPAYMLPPLVGYVNHDKTKEQMPAYSFAGRQPFKVGSVSPGPAYNIGNLTAKGPYRPPAYSITGRGQGGYNSLGPGPGAYKYDINLVKQRPPAYSMLERRGLRTLGCSPGPIYMLPTTIGPKVPDKTAAAEVTMKGRSGYVKEGASPGFYDIGSPCVVKPCLGGITIKGRHDASLKTYNAGPASYDISKMIEKVRTAPPAYSMGIRHSPCTAPLLTMCDTQDETGPTCCSC